MECVECVRLFVRSSILFICYGCYPEVPAHARLSCCLDPVFDWRNNLQHTGYDVINLCALWVSGYIYRNLVRSGKRVWVGGADVGGYIMRVIKWVAYIT